MRLRTSIGLAWAAGILALMTSIVNHDGVVFQKDLGEDTEAAAGAIDAYDPDPSWVAVTEDGASVP